jgi:hypothetical protein
LPDGEKRIQPYRGVGVFLTLFGVYLLLFVYGFASMVDPKPAGWDLWGEFLIHVNSLGGWPVIVVGFLLVVYGITLVVRGIRIKRREAATSNRSL